MRFRDVLMVAAQPQRGASPDAAVAFYVASVVANGGTVSAGRQTLLRTLIQASMDCGHWWATDDIPLLTAEDAGSALTLMKSGVLMTPVNAPTFTVDRGYAFNGTTQYIDTVRTLASNTNLRAGESRIEVYERTDVNANTVAIGTTSGSNLTFGIRPRSTSTSIVGNAGSGNASFTIAADSRGLSVVSRTGAGTTVKGWKNGVALTDATGIAVNNATPTGRFFIGARNNGTPDTFRASTIGCAAWGAPLPGGTTAELAWYTALQTFMTAIGANV